MNMLEMKREGKIGKKKKDQKKKKIKIQKEKGECRMKEKNAFMVGKGSCENNYFKCHTH